MKKTIITLALAGLLLSTSTAYATTGTTASVDQLIAQLREQITQLQTQIAALKAAQTSVATSKQSVNDTLKLIGDMKEGMTGEQVTLLQATLAADPAIYPEGKITGYYGKLTTQAIKRFQKRYGLPQTGTMSSSTIAQMNRVLEQHRVSREDDDDDHDGIKRGRICIPPGHMVAAGWIKQVREKKGDDNKKGNGNIRFDDKDLLLPYCKNINASSTPIVKDTVAPVIASVSVTGITTTGVTVNWTTNEKTSSRIFLGTTSPVATGTAAWTDGSFALVHVASLSGLSANTTYYFLVEAKDLAGNVTQGAQGSFTTSVVPDTTAPSITALSATPTSSTTATIAWTTSEAAGGKVYFGTTSPLATSTATSVVGANSVTAHSVLIAGLSASTTYYTIVESRDAAGNKATSGEVSFTTPL